MAGKFSFFESFDRAASKLGDADRLALFDAMRDFAFRGVVPEFEGVMAIVWDLVEPNITSSIKAQESGSKGGRGNSSKDNRKATTKPELETTHKTTAGKRRSKAEVSTDMDMEEEGKRNLPLEEDSSSPSSSDAAAAADAAPPDEATVPRCPMCGGTMRYDPSERLWRGRDGAGRAPVKPQEP